MKRACIRLAVVLAGISLVSCGSSNRAQTNSRLTFRAFVSNPLFPSFGAFLPVVNIVDASAQSQQRDFTPLSDQLSPFPISLQGTVTDPESMLLTPDRTKTVVYSGADTSITQITNATESIYQPSGTSGGSLLGSSALKLPAAATSIVISPFGTTAYVAMPSASVVGQAPGAVAVVDLTKQLITATVAVPSVQTLLLSPDGNHILAFANGSNAVTTIAVSLIGTSSDPRTFASGFDRPVGGIYMSNTSALIFNCGPECGGSQAGIAVYGVGTAAPASTLAVPAVTAGLLSGSTLYIAGSAPGTPCPSGTLATSCGTLSIVDTGSMTVTSSTSITDGYHNLMSLTPDGQLFIGANNCTNINAQNGSSKEVRGCLAVFDTTKSAVVIPPENGNVTGLQPISGRSVIYVCQGGGLFVYDTPSDQLAATQPNFVGNATDVLLVDLPN